MNNAIKVVVEHFGGRSLLSRHYNVAAELSSVGEWSVALPVAARDMTTLGPTGANLVEAIQEDVEGIEYVRFTRYALEVRINPAFDWEAIDAGILGAISMVLRSDLSVSRVLTDLLNGTSAPLEEDDEEAIDLGAPRDEDPLENISFYPSPEDEILFVHDEEAEKILSDEEYVPIDYDYLKDEDDDPERNQVGGWPVG